MEQFIFDSKNRTSISLGEDVILLTGDEHFHLSHVLRSKVGDQILATDGKGMTCLCLIQAIDRNGTTCKVIEERRNFNSSRRGFCVGLAVLKPVSKLELAIEKCTELGAGEFLVFNTERSWKVGLRPERIADIIVSAVKQSLQSEIPELRIVEDLNEALLMCRRYKLKLVLHEKSETMIDEILNKENETLSAIALVGPEGGFTENEISFLVSEGFKSVRVGSSRLKSETAAIKIASLLGVY